MPQKQPKRYYFPHHFIFYPLLVVLISVSIYYSCAYPEKQMEWVFITILLFLIGGLSFMLRQHYALGNQDRIIRLEMRLRYYQLTNQRFESIEKQLSFKQIAALRFASDDELPALVKRTIEEKLSSSTIKYSIVNWIPDHMRV